MISKEDFNTIAWHDFIAWAAEQPEMKKAFADDTGVADFAQPGMTKEGTSDAAVAYADAFVRWVTINYWGLEFAPATYRASIETPR